MLRPWSRPYPPDTNETCVLASHSPSAPRRRSVIPLGAQAISSGPMAVATEREYGLFIDGELREPEAGEIRELTEPATGQPLAKAAMAGGADVDRAVEAARAALAGPWAKTPATERSRLLHA